MMNQIARIGILLIGINYHVQAQTKIEVSNELLDSIYISDVEEKKNRQSVACRTLIH